MNAGELVSGKYRLQRLLGAGSMGSVWAARNELTDRDFAVKFLLPELAQNDDALHRFFHEARACGQIRNPAIVDVYDMGRAEDGSPYLVMELLEGEGFDARLARTGRMRPVDVCRYLILVARGLEEAHARGLIHRDLKPGNIFFAVDKSGEVHPKVLDFGISKETRGLDLVETNAGIVLGSPAYMSPEQARGELDVDARADLWALGVIMYEALSTELPFDATNYNALMVKIIDEPHRPLSELAPGVPTELCQLVDVLLQKDRTRRLASAAELAQRLERIYVRLTDTPLLMPERQTTVPPPHERLPSGQRLEKPTFVPTMLGSRVMFAVGLFGLLSVAGWAVLARQPKRSPLAPTRFAQDVGTVVIRARTRLSETLADKKTLAAEEATRGAEKRAVDAEKGRRDLELSTQRRPDTKTTTIKTTADDPHGGVVGPGF